MNRAEEIAANLDKVRERVDKALIAVKRSSQGMCLLAVSKTVPPEDIAAALAAGQRDFAENYAQEFRDKHRAVASLVADRGLPEPRWHFIGPLQTNKVKYVAGKVVLVHSAGSAEALAEIDRKAGSAAVVQDCLVQVNVAGESQKSGIVPAKLPAMLDEFASLSHVRCTGLMLIPPYDEDAERSRPHFAALRRLRDQHRPGGRPHVVLAELSMGMSHDLEVAISEGATIVRVGTAIFGART
jgi:PLP dependent protein